MKNYSNLTSLASYIMSPLSLSLSLSPSFTWWSSQLTYAVCEFVCVLYKARSSIRKHSSSRCYHMTSKGISLRLEYLEKNVPSLTKKNCFHFDIFYRVLLQFWLSPEAKNVMMMARRRWCKLCKKRAGDSQHGT